MFDDTNTMLLIEHCQDPEEQNHGKNQTMPWIKEEDCIACGVCVAECPVEAISLEDDAAQIDDQECIRCGRCHDVCAEDAVRHDSERIPADVDANIQWTKDLFRHFETREEKHGLVERMKRYFAKEQKVAQQTIERLAALDKEL
jgi:ferredoxin